MLPKYDDLPDGKAWGVWGQEGTDVFGCLNLLTPERVQAGVACVQRGVVFALNLDMELPDPPLFGRQPFTHEVQWLDHEVGHDDFLHGWNTQSSSQWDGFRHIRHGAHGFYGGVADEDHGIHHWARRGIAGRAVLCDVSRWRESIGRPLQHGTPDPIDPEDLLATLEAQGSEVEPGDILLLRTGWTTWYRGLSADERAALAVAHASPGLRAGVATARMLWDLHIAALGVDNPAVEVWPPGSLLSPEDAITLVSNPETSPEVFVHFALLPLLGLPLGEFWDLDALADDCAADGRYHCMFTSAPLNLRAGVASPPNALALK
jgi:kynurenine formamidase